MTEFAPNAMTALIDDHYRYDLAESTCPPVSLGDLAEPGELAAIPLGYGTTRGDARLRELIAADAGVNADQVLVTVGAIEAMFLLAQAVCGPGDRVLLVTPCFPPARTVPEGLGAHLDLVAATFDDGYRLPLDRVVAALGPRTRLVSLASPQNPSGVRVTESEVRELLAAVRERAPQAVVLVDETYRESTYADAPVPPSAAVLPGVVTCSSVSKAHGAPGLRLGWLTATDQTLYARLREAEFVTTIACSGVDEFLATRVLQRRAEILAPRTKFLGEQLGELRRWAADQPVDLVVPDGGPLSCVRLRPEIDVARFYARLAERETRVSPGSWFGEDDRVFRLGFGHLSPAEFSEALSRVAEALSLSS
ncbi:pyridoxal phosphate-dependent aminotransferase [Actinoplanes sp. NBC_00393]|uniref:pyridoxal phosphate-dependent aminotransferase n=1 Tax=Actinoplanes sp. NBC_00393 TaxID=2975953 RepID=UPI002E24C010